MIYELDQLSYVLQSTDCSFPEALAVIEGNNPGWVFADDPETPRSALVWAQGIQGFYLLGEPDNQAFLESLDEAIDLTLQPRLRKLGIDWFEVCGGEDWDPVIESLFRDRDLERSQQFVYELAPKEQTITSPPKIGQDCKLLRIDRKLLADIPANNPEFLRARLALFWGGEDAFLKSGLGYALLRADEIASLCISGFVAAKRLRRSGRQGVYRRLPRARPGAILGLHG